MLHSPLDNHQKCLNPHEIRWKPSKIHISCSSSIPSSPLSSGIYACFVRSKVPKPRVTTAQPSGRTVHFGHSGSERDLGEGDPEVTNPFSGAFHAGNGWEWDGMGVAGILMDMIIHDSHMDHSIKFPIAPVSFSSEAHDSIPAPNPFWDCIFGAVFFCQKAPFQNVSLAFQDGDLSWDYWIID